MNGIIHTLKRFCRFIAGFVFYISGIVKLMDPVGAGLVMDEYLNFLHLGFLGFFSKPLGVAFALIEALLGAALVSGVWRRVAAVTAFALQGFFTILTLILVIFNPEMDCGCFGEVISLTHIQTFIKNIIILLILVVSFIPMKHLGIPKKKKYVSFAVVAASTVLFTIFSWISIPLVDFTAYEPGVRLLSAESDQSDSEEMYEAVFVYEKDGKQEEFSLDALPDSTWTFVETKTILKDEQYDRAIELSFYDTDGEYADMLAGKGKTMVMSFYKTRTSDRKWEKATSFVRDAESAGFRPLILYSGDETSLAKEMESLEPENAEQVMNNLYFSDYKTLITLNRSNGGITFFSDGFLICKWSSRRIPDRQELAELEKESETETLIGYESHGSLILQGFLLYVFAVMLLI